MELIKSLPRHKPSEVAYFVINAILPIVILLLVRSFDPPYIAVALIVLSKWRVFALQPRFWWANIRANAVDLLVGLSVVGLLYLSANALVTQILITAAYTAWLLYLKPRSDTSSIALQAGVTQFLALTALFGFSNVIPEVLVVLGTWLIAYVTARHFVSNFNEQFTELISIIWAFCIAELGWLLYHWTLIYKIDSSFSVPQIAVLTIVIAFTAARTYAMSRQMEDDNTARNIRYTLIFGSLLSILILFFAKWNVVI